MKIAIYSNLIKDPMLSTTVEFADRLKSSGFDVVVADNVAIDGYTSVDRRYLGEAADIIVVLGGDGTILTVAGLISHYPKPLLGINLGSKGFMTSAERSQLDYAVSCLVNGKYYIQDNIMLKVCTRGRIHYALNDVVVGRNTTLKLIPTQVYIDGKFYYTYHADGVLVSTPTGSTAYFLSAGGPIITPGTHCMGIIGICQHSLYNRALIVNDNQTVTMKTLDDSARVFVDGTCAEELSTGDDVTISKSDRVIQLIRFDNDDFYTRLMTKLASTLD